MTYGVNSPMGMQAVTYGLAAPWVDSIQVFPITANYPTPLFMGDLITFTNGQVVRYDTNGSSTIPAGVFWGCTFFDPNGDVKIQKYWPAAQGVRAGTTALANIVVDTNNIFTIQCSGTIAWSNLSKNADVTFATPGNSATGDSGMMLDVTTLATTNTLPLHIIGFDPIQGNTPAIGGTSVPYANVLVKLNNTLTNAGSTGV